MGEFQKELTIHEEKLESVKDRLASIDILKKAFSTNGLLAYKIENLVKDLEELILFNKLNKSVIEVIEFSIFYRKKM